MGGGLMQLVAYGAQDIYLSGNPQITFFKVVYRRHTNFSMESIEQTFNGTADFGKKVSCTLSRNGDLVTKCYLEVTLPALTATAGTIAYFNEVGHFLIKSVEVEIGGQRIDKHYGTWLSVWASLTVPTGQRSADPASPLGYDEMIGDVSALTTAAASLDAYTLTVPLQFWFCRHTGLALPLIALQYHEVKFNLEFESLANLIDGTVDSASLGDTTLYVDYIYLDTDERRRFAQISHEYLIEQLQFTGDVSVSGLSNRVKLDFNHPVKELVWVVKGSDTGGNNFLDDSDVSPTVSAKLQLNGHDRFSTRTGQYFGKVQPYQHHSNTPLTGVNVYSFALKPEEHQPSGSCNMSRIDNATLNLTVTASTLNLTEPVLKIYATNYNVLRIMSGMGGLAYSN